MAERHRPYRLDEDAYNEPGTIAHVIAVTKRRVRFFERADISNMATSILLERAARDDVPIYAYCLMPDHAHLLIGASRSCGIARYVSEVKSFIARGSWPLGVKRTIWQTSFRDEIERSPTEELWGDVRYVFRNPVDDGIVEKWSDYPYSGSTVYSAAQIEEIFTNPIFYRSRNRNSFVSLPEPE
jgi:putative transposase